MAWTKYDTPEEKKLLQERAQLLKPNVPGVIATELGWAIPSARGPLEILVRYDGLDTLLGDEISEIVQVGEPLTIVPEAPAPVIVVEDAKIELATELPKTEAVAEDAKPVKAKPGPKPKAVK